MPKSVTQLGDQAFYFCSNLTSATILGNITVIEESLFMNCFSLSFLEILKTVNRIGSLAFSSTNLNHFIIPENVNQIDEIAFANIPRLKYVKFLGLENPNYRNITNSTFGCHQELCRVFSNTLVEVIYVNDNYQDDNFCSYPILNGELPTFDFTKSDMFSKSDELTKSAEFTKRDMFSKSDEFTKSAEFTKSNEFTDSNFFTTPFDVRSITIYQTYVQSFTYIKSVSYSLSYFESYSNTMSVDENNVAVVISLKYEYYTYKPYIIHFLSPTYIPTILLEVKFPKKSLSQSQLIGIVCGSAAVFFFTLGLIIMIQQKKNEIKSAFESSSSDIVKEINQNHRISNDYFFY